ncbi:MAG: DUF4184 family protein [Promethearchaeota archaeon]
MPSGVLSHQAPGLILKVKYPNKFDGTALCISTIVPDVNIIFDPFLSFTFRNITHSLLGLILITLPLTLILTMLFCTYIGPFYANLAKRNGIFAKPLKYFGIDQWDNLKKKKYNRKFFIVASYSALIGGLTHLLLDLPAHENIEIFFPIIMQSPDILLYSIKDFGTINIGRHQIDADLTVYQLIWFIETLITAVIAVYLLRYIKKHNLISKWYKEI